MEITYVYTLDLLTADSVSVVIEKRIQQPSLGRVAVVAFHAQKKSKLFCFSHGM